MATEKVVEVAETLDRIPNLHLNGTTKGQQILILSTMTVIGIASGVGGSIGFKKLRQYRENKKKSIAKFDVDHNKFVVSDGE